MNIRKGIGIKAISVLLLATGGVIAAALSAGALWTDNIGMEASVSALDIGIEYGEQGLLFDKSDDFMPGEMATLSFVVKNSGSISADIKPVITIRSDKKMRLGISEYYLCDENGDLLDKEYDISYFNGEDRIDAAHGVEYDRAEYERKTQNTLYGSRQSDEELDLDEESGSLINEKAYQCRIRLSEECDNGFMGSRAELSIDTYAIQHRFSEGIGSIDRSEWQEAPATGSFAKGQ